MHPVPALLITGAAGPAKHALVAALIEARPAAERWALLDNDGGSAAAQADNAAIASAVAAGCACCSGQVTLHTALVRLLRASRPQRLLVVADAAAEPDALERALRQEHLARALRISLRLCAIDPARMAAANLNAQGLWLRQMKTADRVVVASAAETAPLRASGLAALTPGEAASLALTAPAPAS